LLSVRRAVPICAWLAALAILAASAAAAAQPPKPGIGCAGLSFADARGDAVDDGFGLGFGPAARANLDLLAGWLRTDGASVTANIQVAELDKTPTSGSTASVWTFNWFAGGQRFFVQARAENQVVTYSYGTYDQTSAVYNPDPQVQVAGSFFEGPDGVVQIELPPRHAQPGIELERPFAEASTSVGSSLSGSDRAPDSTEGEAFVVRGCLDGQPGAKAPAVKTPAKAAPRLPLRSVTTLGSAARAQRRGSLGFKVRGLRTIRDLKVRLVDQRGRVLAGGGLRRLSGVHAVKLSLHRGVKVKAGAYVLHATGSVGGRRLATKIPVSLRR
jgi:hypothetical protein